MREYQKTPKVDILVPVGSKALMPGHLYHTSEVLVSHGSGYFSDCTTIQAIEIANKRIKIADDRLKELQVEREMYQNKLKIPFSQEAFADGGQEIIEEYDEEREKTWRIEHQKRVKEQKLKEAEIRNNEADVEKTDENIMDMLDELELMEELESEMEALEIENNEDKTMTGEIKLNEKNRVAHCGSDINHDNSINSNELNNGIVEEPRENID